MCGADRRGYKTFCATCGIAIGGGSDRARPPRRSRRILSGRRVLVAVGLFMLVGTSRWLVSSGWPAGSHTVGSEEFVAGSAPLGDDARLDALWLRCGTGEHLACDLLRVHGDPASDYERYGESCGNANEPDPEGELCVQRYDGSPDLRQLHRDCLDGDLVACDGLYAFSGTGSEYQQVGATCGGRMAEPSPESVGACFMRFEADG